MSLCSDQDLIDCIERSLATAMASAGVDTTLARQIIETVENDLRKEYGGERPYVRAPCRQGRNREIIVAWRAGVSRADIASQLGIDKSTVSRVISKHLEDRSNREGFGSAEWNL